MSTNQRSVLPGGWKIQLQVTLERGAGDEAGVEGEDGHHLLLHIDPGLAAIGCADLIQSKQEYSVIQKSRIQCHSKSRIQCHSNIWDRFYSVQINPTS